MGKRRRPARPPFLCVRLGIRGPGGTSETGLLTPCNADSEENVGERQTRARAGSQHRSKAIRLQWTAMEPLKLRAGF